MSIKGLTLIAAVSCAIMVSGCAKKTTSPEQYSGFLMDYSGLQETKSASGHTILRWIDPAYKTANYHHIIYNPITYYPTPRPTTQIGQQTLDSILNYTNTKMKASIAQRLPLTTTPGPGTLTFRGAITAVDASREGLQFYEVIPIAMVIAGTQAATGHRTMNTTLFFEGELIDSSTNKVVMKVVRKGQGKDLSNSNKQLTLNDLKSVIDGLATDATLFDAGK
ncbi:hypothetical protein TUM12370_29520 [Salmonella enterica subsp. enterica serovar Choleraesuis]|nr:hypothetical protein TUM12370_29520 [Salmonella enterica subsp. enterica serovar Choleraesuis]